MKGSNLKKPIVLILGGCCVLFSCSTKEVLPPVARLPVPTESQLAWHEMEMNAFIHFTTNTFTDKEWGYGDELPAIFNPSALNAEQWVGTIRDAGFKGVILTCKHHDGFCLWPSEYTDHSVKSSPWKNGKGDVVSEVSLACKKYGLKFGVYLSPWDRNHKDYGASTYLTYYRNQLKELFTRYGPIFEMWFDGANGGDGYYGGRRDKRNIDGSTYYDWPTTLELVRKLEPHVIFFSDAGPGVRWVGNEKGIAGETNWNTITPDSLFAGKGGIEKLLNTGSENGTAWIPAEVDVSIRPGWFYHEKEDTLVKTPEKLFDIYLTSVGRGATLLLNIPPDRRGLLHENDVKALKGFKELLNQEFKTNLAFQVDVDASSYRGDAPQFSPGNLTDGDNTTYWATDDSVENGSIEINLVDKHIVKYILIQEHIRLGQRVKTFSIETWQDDQWKPTLSGTTIGHKRILKIEPVETNKIKINFASVFSCLLISNIEVY